jgi:hypothetical protein
MQNLDDPMQPRHNAEADGLIKRAKRLEDGPPPASEAPSNVNAVDSPEGVEAVDVVADGTMADAVLLLPGMLGDMVEAKSSSRASKENTEEDMRKDER